LPRYVRSVVVELALVDDVDAKSEGSGDFVEEPGVVRNHSRSTPAEFSRPVWYMLSMNAVVPNVVVVHGAGLAMAGARGWPLAGREVTAGQSCQMPSCCIS
jgi:hypothetical protein